MRLKRNRFIVSALLLIATGVFISSCGGGSKENPTPTESLTLSLSSLSFTATGTSGSLSVTSASNWTASANESSVKVNPSSGTKGTTAVTITIPENTTKQQKTYSVTFTSGKSSKILSIVQAAKGESYAPVTVSPSELSIANASGSTGQFTITCNGDWSISSSNKPAWLTSFSVTAGSGNATITVTTGANAEKTEKSYIVQISSGSNKASLTIKKAAAENHAPTKPTNLSPTGSGVSRTPTFSWTASTDADNDQLKYTVKYSKNNSNWTSLTATTATSVAFSGTLDASTTYYWKVEADDSYNGKTESDVVSFTTEAASTNSYEDLEIAVYQQATSGAKPVVLIFTGDGYTKDMFNYGGQFDQDINAQIEALFAIEPFKTYRNYFTVYKIAAYSNQAGISQGESYDNRTKVVDTRFKCTWEGSGTGIDCDLDEVLSVASNIPGMKGNTDSKTYMNLTWAPVSITINANVYAGTNIWWATDEDHSATNFEVGSVAQTPAKHPNYGSYSGSAYTLRHEFGGHGFGLLDDEYVYYTNTTIPNNYKQQTLQWKNYSLIGCLGNVTFETQKQSNQYVAKSSCEWYQFIGRSEYAAAAIGVYEGAEMYGKGIWRPEYISCMDDNRPHFNTPSRYQIYRRIKITAGETPSIEDFIAHDNDKVQSFSAPVTKTTAPRFPRPTLIRHGQKVKAYGKNR